VGEPLTGHTGPVSAVAIGHVGDRDVIVSGGGDSVRIWSAAHAETLVQDTLDPVNAAALAGNLLTFAAGTAICAAIFHDPPPT
jgi:hypothetical protein